MVKDFTFFHQRRIAAAMKTHAPDYAISDPRQLEVLISQVRQEIVDALSELGTVSVNELAAALGRPADGLYYHLRALKDVGLVVSEGYRSGGARPEELIRAVSPNLKLKYLLGEPGNLDSISAIVAAMLRLGTRDFNAALHRQDLVTEGPLRDLWAIRKTAWLDRRELRIVNALIEKVRRTNTRSRGQGRRYAMTILLTPLSHDDDADRGAPSQENDFA